MSKDAAIFRVNPVKEGDMAKLRRRWGAMTAVLTVGVTLGSTPAWAQKPPPGPKGDPMRGTWGFSVSGTIVTPDGAPQTPVAIVGLITFDPLTRDCVVEDRINAGGTSVRRTGATCTYSHPSERYASLPSTGADKSRSRSRTTVPAWTPRPCAGRPWKNR